MINPGYPLDAFVIVDNNAIVGISEYCFSAYQRQNFRDAVPLACQNIDRIFDAIRKFAYNQTIYTTPCVKDEFKPENGELKNFPSYQNYDCEVFKAHVLGQIEALEINMSAIGKLRGMQQAPPRLRTNLAALSDQDLSLIILALGLANKINKLVYILVDEEDLRYFTTWMRTKPEVKQMCAHSENIQALHTMTYLDSIHRNCALPSDLMFAMFGYQSKKQMRRTFLSGTTKGGMITDTYDQIYYYIQESSSIKLTLKGNMQ